MTVRWDASAWSGPWGITGGIILTLTILYAIWHLRQVRRGPSPRCQKKHCTCRCKDCQLSRASERDDNHCMVHVRKCHDWCGTDVRIKSR